MKYIVNLKSAKFDRALGLDKSQVKRLEDAINKAYEQNWDELGPNIDQINGFVAPYIRTSEEAFYTASLIISQVMGTMMEMGESFKPDK